MAEIYELDVLGWAKARQFSVVLMQKKFQHLPEAENRAMYSICHYFLYFFSVAALFISTAPSNQNPIYDRGPPNYHTATMVMPFAFSLLASARTGLTSAVRIARLKQPMGYLIPSWCDTQCIYGGPKEQSGHIVPNGSSVRCDLLGCSLAQLGRVAVSSALHIACSVIITITTVCSVFVLFK